MIRIKKLMKKLATYLVTSIAKSGKTKLFKTFETPVEPIVVIFNKNR